MKTLINSLAWYSGWALGLPEMLIDFVSPGLKLNPTLLRYWGDFYSIIFSTFAMILTGIMGIITYLLLKKRVIFKNKKFWFFLFWFPISILPILLFPTHKSTYYLAPALPAFWTIMGLLCFSVYWDLKRKWPVFATVLLISFSMIFFSLSATSVKLGKTTYWAAQRGSLAKKLITQVVYKYPTLPKGAAVYFSNDPTYPFVAEDWGGTSRQASLALNNDDALKLLYNDPTIKVFYEDLGGIPKDFPKDKIYSLVAIIN